MYSAAMRALALPRSLDRGSIETLRKLGEIDVPDSDNTEGRGDVLDAMVVGLHMIRQRTLKKWVDGVRVVRRARSLSTVSLVVGRIP